MPMLENSKIEEIRKSVNIIDVIGEYIPLTQRGRNYFCVCPFHDDHSPSMSISNDLQIYTCFSCGATGNVFKFLMDYEHITFMDALAKVAAKGGIDINVNTYTPRKVINNEIYQIYDIAAKFYQNNLNSSYGIEAKEYLKKREIDETIIKEFGIGLSLIKNDVLTNLLLKKEFKNDDLIKSGLIVENQNGLHDIYMNRIMFPLMNLEGKIVGFSGRIYNTKDNSKYINTRETEIFKKGEILYNYYRAKDECRIKKTVIIMEGFMDVIRAYTIGVKNVVASMGTAITKEQAHLLKRLAPNIILLFDGDVAGEKATIACIEELNKIDVIPKVVRLEEGLDPDDYIKKYGKEKFLNKLNSPIDVMEFKMNYLKNNKNLDDSVDLADYINECLKDLEKIDDDILREITLKKLSETSSLDIELLRTKLTKKEISKNISRPVKSPVKKYYDKCEIAERNLIYRMLNSTEVIKKYMKRVTFMPHDQYRILANKIRFFYEEHDNKFDPADFYTIVNNGTNEKMQENLNSILNTNLEEQFDASEIDDYIKVINEYNLKNEAKKIENETKEDIDFNLKQEKLKKIVELKLRGEKND